MTTAGIYLRVSTEDQVERFGLKAMETEARALAARKGYTVAEAYIDDGYSGATLERPALDRLRADLRAGKPFDVLLIPDPDRLARRLALQLLLIDEIERAGVAIEWGSGPRQQTEEGRLLDNVRGVFAEYERAKILTRTTRGRLEKARRGFIVGGRRPFGYVTDPASPGHLVVHDEQASIIRMMFRWLVEEQRSTRSIAVELRALGIRATRGWWSRSSIQVALTNPAYVGRAYYNRREPLPGATWGVRMREDREWIMIPIPAILDEATFERARLQLERNRAVMVGRPAPLLYLLRGLVVCGACGGRLQGERTRDTGYYRCRARCGYLVRTSRVDGPVWATILDLLQSPGAVAGHLESYRATLATRGDDAKAKVEALERQAAVAQRDEQKILDLYLSEDMKTEAVAGRLKALGAHRTALRGQIDRARAAAASQEAQEGGYATLADQCALLAKGARKLRPEERQRVLRRLVRSVVCRPSGELEITGFLPLKLSGLVDLSWQFDGVPYRVLTTAGAAR